MGTTIPVGGRDGQTYEFSDRDCLNKNERRIANGNTSIDALMALFKKLLRKNNHVII